MTTLRNIASWVLLGLIALGVTTAFLALLAAVLALNVMAWVRR